MLYFCGVNQRRPRVSPFTISYKYSLIILNTFSPVKIPAHPLLII